MKRIFKLGSKAETSGGSSDSVCSSGDGGVKIKSMRIRTSGEMDPDGEMQFQTLIPPRDRDALRLSDDEEVFHNVELRLPDEDEKSNSASVSSESDHSEVRHRSSKKKKKTTKKGRWGISTGQDARCSSKKVKCCSVS